VALGLFPLPGGWNAMAFYRWSDVEVLNDLEDVLLPGTSVRNGQYRVWSFLGCGGFANAYLATDSQNREVVLKECFVPEFCRRSQSRVVPRSEARKRNLDKVIQGFMDEATTLKTLSHPNIVQAHEAFLENGTAYVVLDYIQGHDLQQIVDEKRGSLAPELIVAMARRLISALAHIHDQGFLHCDIAPDNVILGRDGNPVLIDFGSARRSNVGRAQDGFSMVKDGYSPPELYAKNAPRAPQADIYSLGATLYHSILGVVPPDSQTRRTAMIEGRPDPLKPLAGTVKGYPAGFLASIDRAMAVRTAARHWSAQDWLRALAEPPLAGQVDPLRLRSATQRAATGQPVVPLRPVRSVPDQNLTAYPTVK